jgi:hypothetical protein
MTLFPYDNIALRIAQIEKPFTFEKFKQIFCDISNQVNIDRDADVNIQLENYKVYTLTPFPSEISKKYLPIPPVYFYYEVEAVLLVSEDNFYFLFHCGFDSLLTEHTFQRNIDILMSLPNEIAHVSKGRFIHKKTKNIISAEEDENDVNYLLLTNSEWLLNYNDVFLFTRDKFNF